MVFTCEYCGKAYNFYTSKWRHVKREHSDEMSQQNDDEVSQATEEPEEKDIFGSEDEDSEEEDTPEVASGWEEGATTTEGEQDAAWKKVLDVVFKNLFQLHPELSEDELLAEPYFTTIVIPEVMKIAENSIRQMMALHDSEVYTAIDETKNRLVKDEEYKEWEANLAAWEKRKFLVKQLIKEHMAQFEEEEEEEED